MRCIETYMSHSAFQIAYMINYNMRCIETFKVPMLGLEETMINYNMRCIETYFAFHIPMQSIWDKLQHEMY